jgi:RNA polymerase sigma-70 factor (ECF subfamily)
MDSSRDEELVQRCRNGDREALESLVLKYQKPVYNAAFRVLGNAEDAADATQSAFLKAFEHLDSFNPRFKFFSWIYRIVVNESINQLHRNRKQQSLGDAEIASHAVPEDAVEAGDLSQEIQLGLMGLGEDYRTVVVLRHFADCSYRQISEILQIPEKTVKSRLFTARRAMKDRLLARGVGL